MANKKTDKNPEVAPFEEAAPKKPGLLGQILPLALTVVLMPVLAYVTTVFVLVPQLKQAVSVAAKAPHGDTDHADSHSGDSHGSSDSHGGSHGASDSHGGGHGATDSHGGSHGAADSHGGGHGASDSHGGGHGAADSHGGGHGGGHGAAKSGSKTFDLPEVVVNVKNTLGQRYLIVEMTLVGPDDSFSSSVEGIVYKFQDLAIGILRQKSIQDLEQNLAQNTIRSELLNAFNNFMSRGKEPVIKQIYFKRFAVQ